MTNSVKWLRIRVSDLQTGKSKANVRIPASLANFGMKMAAKYAHESLEGLDINQLMATLKDGSDDLLVNVEDDEKSERVEIFME